MHKGSCWLVGFACGTTAPKSVLFTPFTKRSGTESLLLSLCTCQPQLHTLRGLQRQRRRADQPNAQSAFGHSSRMPGQRLGSIIESLHWASPNKACSQQVQVQAMWCTGKPDLPPLEDFTSWGESMQKGLRWRSSQLSQPLLAYLESVGMGKKGRPWPRGCWLHRSRPRGCWLLHTKGCSPCQQVQACRVCQVLETPSSVDGMATRSWLDCPCGCRAEHGVLTNFAAPLLSCTELHCHDHR
jgi:hypothetical protein